MKAWPVCGDNFQPKTSRMHARTSFVDRANFSRRPELCKNNRHSCCLTQRSIWTSVFWVGQENWLSKLFDVLTTEWIVIFFVDRKHVTTSDTPTKMTKKSMSKRSMTSSDLLASISRGQSDSPVDKTTSCMDAVNHNNCSTNIKDSPTRRRRLPSPKQTPATAGQWFNSLECT